MTDLTSVKRSGTSRLIRSISGSARDIGHNLRKISDFLNEAGSEARIKVSGLKVGIRTAIEVLIKNLLLNKGGSQ